MDRQLKFTNTNLASKPGTPSKNCDITSNNFGFMWFYHKELGHNRLKSGYHLIMNLEINATEIVVQSKSIGIEYDIPSGNLT
jgi:hypothetical protein